MFVAPTAPGRDLDPLDRVLTAPLTTTRDPVAPIRGVLFGALFGLATWSLLGGLAWAASHII